MFINTYECFYKTCLFRSFVALSGKSRILGVAAKNQMVTNMKNTIYGFKRLLGRKYNDPHVQQELKYLPFRVIQQPNGNIGIKVRLSHPRECVFLCVASYYFHLNLYGVSSTYSREVDN
jgi:molecular chaperone DnaK (HSP70)